jgi:DNA adenine methylase
MTQDKQQGSLVPVAMPFLKWPGGKRWACPVIVPLIRKFLRGAYYEPFLGGGAVFFALCPSHAVLSDLNPEIVNTYRQVRHRHEELIRALKKLPVDAETYYRLRARSGIRSPIAEAVRFLYLNRTAFGGIYRLNQRGDFNVPFGGGQRTPSMLWERGILKNAAEALRHARIRKSGFEEPLTMAGEGDVVYCDPTYTVAHNNNGFGRYNEKNFSWVDQQRLAALCKEAAGRGASVLVSNAYHEEIRCLYRPCREIVLTRTSLVARNPSFRREIKEILFVLHN